MYKLMHKYTTMNLLSLPSALWLMKKRGVNGVLKNTKEWENYYNGFKFSKNLKASKYY